MPGAAAQTAKGQEPPPNRAGHAGLQIGDAHKNIVAAGNGQHLTFGDFVEGQRKWNRLVLCEKGIGGKE